jgi:hypothetical protein
MNDPCPSLYHLLMGSIQVTIALRLPIHNKTTKLRRSLLWIDYLHNMALKEPVVSYTICL